MNLEELKSMTMVELGNRPNLGKKTEAAAEFVKATRMEQDPAFHPWFLIASETFSITAGAQDYALPSAFISEYEYGFLLNATKDELVKETYDVATARNKLPDNSQRSGAPSKYVVRNRTLSLFPIPDTTENYTITYYKATEKLIDSTEDNPWLLYASDWLFYETVAKLAVTLEHYDKAKIMKSEAMVARMRILQQDSEELAKNMTGAVR